MSMITIIIDPYCDGGDGEIDNDNYGATTMIMIGVTMIMMTTTEIFSGSCMYDDGDDGDENDDDDYDD